MPLEWGRIGKAIRRRQHLQIKQLGKIGINNAMGEGNLFWWWVQNSGMGKHCPGLCLYPAPALIHIRCLINTGNYRVGRSERLIHSKCTTSDCIVSLQSSVVRVLALGCSISGSGLEQLSALILRLMAASCCCCCCCWAPQPRTQGALPPEGCSWAISGTRVDRWKGKTGSFFIFSDWAWHGSY